MSLAAKLKAEPKLGLGQSENLDEKLIRNANDIMPVGSVKLKA